MKYELKALEDLVRDGYLRKVAKGDLVLFNYTDKTTFERAWQTKYTLHSRGLILNKSTGEVVAKCFPKFFNLGEMETVSLANLPKEEYKVFEKCDGSLGIIYFHDNDWQMATRGSFSSEQALRGLAILKKNYKTNFLDVRNTYLVEIIYPENKIIVNYENQDKLVMLGAYQTDIGWELPFSEVKQGAELARMPYAKEYDYTIEEMIALQKTMPKDQEGFVVRFESGLRVKIKGDEYMKIAKMISHMSPISFWESMENGKVRKEYLQQLPEEFRKDYEPVVQKLEALYEKTLFEIASEQVKLPVDGFIHKDDRKILGLFLSGEHGLKHPSVMFSVLLKKWDAVDSYILKQIRPTGNVIA